jgi:hypothetical protein
MTDTLTPRQYRELLGSALPAVVDADTLEPNLRTLFTASTHRRSLEPEVTIVRGARGVGKTVWFKALQNQLLREVAANEYQLPQLNKTRVHPVFGSELAPDSYPGPAILGGLVERVDPVQVWTAVLLVALGVTEVAELSSWESRFDWVKKNPEPSERALAKADADASARGIHHLLLFDALDRLHPNRDRTDRLVVGILRLALDLRTRTRNLRGKVFIRHDMLDSARLNFPDASKLLSNAADLTWTDSNLYGLLFHHLGNDESDHASTFRSLQHGWREQLREPNRNLYRYAIPYELAGDREIQREVFVQIAGPYMGTDHRKGHTYTWLPNHLMDGSGQLSPRSFLGALARAVEVTQTQYAGHGYAIHYEGIRRGVQGASSTRVSEVTEDLPWVKLAIDPLAGLRVPTELDTITSRWRSADLSELISQQVNSINIEADPSSVRTGPRNPHDYEALVTELMDVGVLTKRADGRIDMPDIYRIAFNIGRRGGVPRLKIS